jgi:hypothetical protein
MGFLLGADMIVSFTPMPDRRTTAELQPYLYGATGAIRSGVRFLDTQ